jgi:hypothetical protein
MLLVVLLMSEVRTQKKDLKGAFWICSEKAPFLNRIFPHKLPTLASSSRSCYNLHKVEWSEWGICLVQSPSDVVYMNAPDLEGFYPLFK